MVGSHQISTFKLGYFDLPLSGGGGSSFVDIDVDLIALQNIFDERFIDRLQDLPEKKQGQTCAGQC